MRRLWLLLLLLLLLAACSSEPDDNDDDDSADDDDSGEDDGERGCENRGGGAVFALGLVPLGLRQRRTDPTAASSGIISQ